MSVVFYGGQGQSVEVDQAFDVVSSTLSRLIAEGAPTLILSVNGRQTSLVVGRVDRVLEKKKG